MAYTVRTFPYYMLVLFLSLSHAGQSHDHLTEKFDFSDTCCVQSMRELSRDQDSVTFNLSRQAYLTSRDAFRLLVLVLRSNSSVANTQHDYKKTRLSYGYQQQTLRNIKQGIRLSIPDRNMISLAKLIDGNGHENNHRTCFLLNTHIRFMFSESTIVSWMMTRLRVVNRNTGGQSPELHSLSYHNSQTHHDILALAFLVQKTWLRNAVPRCEEKSNRSKEMRRTLRGAMIHLLTCVSAHSECWFGNTAMNKTSQKTTHSATHTEHRRTTQRQIEVMSSRFTSPSSHKLDARQNVQTKTIFLIAVNRCASPAEKENENNNQTIENNTCTLRTCQSNMLTYRTIPRGRVDHHRHGHLCVRNCTISKHCIPHSETLSPSSIKANSIIFAITKTLVTILCVCKCLHSLLVKRTRTSDSKKATFVSLDNQHQCYNKTNLTTGSHSPSRTESLRHDWVGHLDDIIHHSWRFTRPDFQKGHNIHHSTSASTALDSASPQRCKQHAQQPYSSSMPSSPCSLCKEAPRTYLNPEEQERDRTKKKRENDVPPAWTLSSLAGQDVLLAFPATRFLPDPTRDPNLDLAHVAYRLATLSALPASVPVSRVRLADAGFYYRGGGDDEVVCYCCRVQHAGWRGGDNPMEVHHRLSPRCQHVLQQEEGGELSPAPPAGPGGGVGGGVGDSGHSERHAPNSLSSAADRMDEDGEGPLQHGPGRHVWESVSTSVGLTHTHILTNGAYLPNTTTADCSTSATTSASRQTTAPVTQNRSLALAQPDSTRTTTTTQSPSRSAGPGRAATSDGAASPYRPSHASGSDNTQGSRRREEGEEPRPLFPRAGLDLGGAVYPMFQDMASRRRTFTTWDEARAPSLDQVLLCGMFYAGYSDCVRCFYCGVGLKHWEATDDVWAEHVRWRPGCEYLRTIKGDHFIRETRRRLEIEAAASPGRRSDSAAPRAAPAAQGRQPSSTSGNQSATAPTSTAAATSTSSVSTSTATTTSAAQASSGSRAADAVTTTAAAARTQSSRSQVTNNSSNSNSSSRSGINSNSNNNSSSSSSIHSSSNNSSSSNGSRSSSSSSSSSSSTLQQDGGGPTGRVEGDAAAERIRLASLQAENRALSERFCCRGCRHANIDTILMPCGHLVLCETCARSVTSCPLCHEAVHATARVHLA